MQRPTTSALVQRPNGLRCVHCANHPDVPVHAQYVNVTEGFYRYGLSGKVAHVDCAALSNPKAIDKHLALAGFTRLTSAPEGKLTGKAKHQGQGVVLDDFLERGRLVRRYFEPLTGVVEWYGR